MTNVGYRSNFELTRNTPYHALTGELWSVFCGVCEVVLLLGIRYWIFEYPMPDFGIQSLKLSCYSNAAVHFLNG